MINRDEHVMLGYNYRMNEMAAAMGLIQLRKLDEFNERRIENSLFLLNELGNVPQPWFRIPKLSSFVRHTFFWCRLIVKSEEGISTRDVVMRLGEQGIEVRERYHEPLYKQKCLVDYSPCPKGCPFSCQDPENVTDYRRLYLPNAETVAGKVIGLPNHPGLTESELSRVVDVVTGLFQEYV